MLTTVAMATNKHSTMDNHATVEAFSLWSVPVMTSYNKRGIGDGVFFVRSRAIYLGQFQLRVSIRAERLQLRLGIRAEQQSSEKSCRVAGERILRY
jgi:hypothetical protein